MNLRQNTSLRTVLAPAKLNLFLEVLGRRSDGFHELETLLVSLRLYDSVSLQPTPPQVDGGPGRITLYVVDARFQSEAACKTESLPTDSQNLVVRALDLLRRRSGCPQGADVQLVKRIPVAAGLGGGSSDAAAALQLANRAWNIGWPLEQLSPLAAELGSDVPFFLRAGAAVCRGRGEQVEPLLGMRPLHFVFVKPPAGLSTADVYRTFDELPGESAARPEHAAELAAALRQGNLVGLGQLLSNRLQSAAARLSPWVDRLRAAFARLDFVGHQLSGSGTSYFGVCRHAQQARRLATILRTQQLGLVYVTRSCC